jgi:hypothetical protein
MKLFTEEEVKKAIRIARSSQNIWATPLTYDEHEVLGKLKFIELLSDNDISDKENKEVISFQLIDEEAEKIYPNDNEYDEIYCDLGELFRRNFIEGAKWMFNKIQEVTNDKRS